MRNGRSVFRLAEMVFAQRQRMRNLPLWARLVARTSNLKFSRRTLSGYIRQRNILLTTCRTCTIVFSHSTNHMRGTATTTPQIKNLIGRVRKNKRVARLFFLMQPIKSMICGCVVAVTVVISLTLYSYYSR